MKVCKLFRHMLLAEQRRKRGQPGRGNRLIFLSKSGTYYSVPDSAQVEKFSDFADIAVNEPTARVPPLA